MSDDTQGESSQTTTIQNIDGSSTQVSSDNNGSQVTFTDQSGNQTTGLWLGSENMSHEEVVDRYSDSSSSTSQNNN